MTMIPTRRSSGQYLSPAFLDPTREFADIYDRMGELMSLALSGFGGFGQAGDGRAPWTPPADVSETDEEYIVRAELPGISKDQVEVILQDRELVIRGEVRDPAQDQDQDQDQSQGQVQDQAQGQAEGQPQGQAEGQPQGQDGQMQAQARQHRSTRRTGRFEYRIYLPNDIQPDQVSAELTDGVLTVKVPKSESAKPHRIEVRG